MEPSDLEDQLKRLHDDSFSWALTCCGGHRADAQDVLQSVYLLVLLGQAKFKGQSEFKTWLFSVIRNQAAKEMRRQMVRRLFFLRSDRPASALRSTPSPDAALQESEREDAFEAALNALPSRQREVLHLVFYEDLTIDSAARVMGISLGAARQHYERGKTRLRRELENSDSP